MLLLLIGTYVGKEKENGGNQSNVNFHCPSCFRKLAALWTTLTLYVPPIFKFCTKLMIN